MIEHLRKTALHVSGLHQETIPYGQYILDEMESVEQRQYYNSLLPGPLQTPDVARAVLREFRPDDGDESIDLLVRARQEREDYNNSTRPSIEYYIDQRVLMTTLPNTNWRRQIAFVIEASLRPHQTIRIIPENTFSTAEDMTSLLTLSNGEKRAYLESYLRGDLYTSDPEITTRVSEMFRRLGALALDADHSRIMLESALIEAPTDNRRR